MVLFDRVRRYACPYYLVVSSRLLYVKLCAATIYMLDLSTCSPVRYLRCMDVSVSSCFDLIVDKYNYVAIFHRSERIL